MEANFDNYLKQENLLDRYEYLSSMLRYYTHHMIGNLCL